MDLTLTPPHRPYIIVLGNEKGGTGKSTLGMHLVVCLLQKGFVVGSVDADGRQGTLSRYMENRQTYIERTGIPLLLSQHHRIYQCDKSDRETGRAQEKEALEAALVSLKNCQCIVVDTPGSDTSLSQEAHTYADMLITPMNDSLVDLDLLVTMDHVKKNVLRPSIYADRVWEQRKMRTMRNGGMIDWIVVRNRLSCLYSRNKEQIEQVLQLLSGRLSFRLGHGLGERVIFRELFLSGLTVLDLEQTPEASRMTLSHLTACQEVRNLVEMIPLEDVLQDKTIATGMSA